MGLQLARIIEKWEVVCLRDAYRTPLCWVGLGPDRHPIWRLTPDHRSCLSNRRGGRETKISNSTMYCHRNIHMYCTGWPSVRKSRSNRRADLHTIDIWTQQNREREGSQKKLTTVTKQLIPGVQTYQQHEIMLSYRDRETKLESVA